MDERLRLYEAVLREQGIDPEQITGTLRTEVRPQSIPLESPENARQSPADTDVPVAQSTVFTPQLIHGQFVDNNLWSRLAEDVSRFWLFESKTAKETKRETNSLHMYQNPETEIEHPKYEVSADSRPQSVLSGFEREGITQNLLYSIF